MITAIIVPSNLPFLTSSLSNDSQSGYSQSSLFEIFTLRIHKMSTLVMKNNMPLKSFLS